MASKVLTITSDLTPLQWTKGGSAPTHAASVSTSDTTRNIYVVISNVTDHLKHGSQPSDVQALTSISYQAKFNLTDTGAAGWIGIRWSVWALGVEIGYKADIYGTNVMYTQTVDVPISGSQAQANDLSFKILSEGGNWAFGAAVIQIYQIVPTLTYTAMVYGPGHAVEGNVSSGRASGKFANGAVEANTTNGMSRGNFASGVVGGHLTTGGGIGKTGA